MATSNSFDTEVKSIANKIGFLATVPYVNMKELPVNEKSCDVCLEPFQKTKHSKEVIDSPARLTCSRKKSNPQCVHQNLPGLIFVVDIIGIACLSRQVLAYNFNNQCAMCRTIVVPPYDHISSYSWSLSYTILLCSALYGSKPTSLEQKKICIQRLRSMEETQWVLQDGIEMNRTMTIARQFFKVMKYDALVADLATAIPRNIDLQSFEAYAGIGLGTRLCTLLGHLESLHTTHWRRLMNYKGESTNSKGQVVVLGYVNIIIMGLVSLCMWRHNVCWKDIAVLCPSCIVAMALTLWDPSGVERTTR